MSFVLYTQPADLYTLSEDQSNSDRERFSLVKAGLRVNIQPAGLEYIATQPDGAIGKLYRCFTTYSGCQIGMRMLISGTVLVSGMMLEITGVEPFAGPFGRTFELLARKSTS